MQRVNWLTAAYIAAALIVIGVAVWLLTRDSGNSDRLTDDQVVGATAADDPERACASQRIFDQIKAELFRRAAEVRGSDEDAYRRLAGYSVLRMDAPMMNGEEDGSGRINCTGTVTLDLPPGVAAAGGRRALSADLGYAIEGRDEGSGRLAGLANADAIVTPLATLVRTTDEPLAAGAEPSPGDLLGNGVAPADGAEPPDSLGLPPEDAAPASTSPSFDCDDARTRGELMVCSDPSLAALDRQMAAQFESAVADANPAQRALLERTRGRFLAYRDGCRSDACVADSYRGRMAEIRDIMLDRWTPQR